jgi:hypothetical protein
MELMTNEPLGSPDGSEPSAAGEAEVLVRPNGKRYRPRAITVHPWMGREDCGAVVLGTHDVQRAARMAEEEVQREFDREYIATKPEPGWYRLGMCRGERRWITDEVRGAAGVYFTADYPLEAEAAAAFGRGEEG